MKMALLSMLGAMISGILISRHVFTFVHVKGAAFFARSLHMLCAYWGFVWMSLHLGIHWGMIVKMAGKMCEGPSPMRKWVARIVSAVIAEYGLYAFVKRDIGSYMLMRSQFVFFDYEEALIFFLLDYVAVMGMFVWVGRYISIGLKRK